MSVPAEELIERTSVRLPPGLCLAIAEDLSTLAALHDRELDRDAVLALWDEAYEAFLGLPLQGERSRKAIALLRQGLTDIPAALDVDTLNTLAVEYADIYLNATFGASPYESVWLDPDHLAMQQPMFAVRAWYRRHRVAVKNWRLRNDDHLVLELQFIAQLMEAGVRDRGMLGEAATFMDQHILRWIDDFAERVGSRCETRLYAGIAALTAAYLDELRALLARLTGIERPLPDGGEMGARERTEPEMASGPYVPGVERSW